MVNKRVPAKTTTKAPAKTMKIARYRGKPKDSAEKRFMKRNDVFADVFNGYLYQGKKVIEPDKLTAADPVSTSRYINSLGDTEYSERIRDVLKRAVIYSDGHKKYVLLGIENQSTIDPIMVYRCLEYDMRTFSEQIDKQYRRKRKASNGSASSYEAPSDGTLPTILPVITLVVYFGPEKWTGPKTFHEFIGLTDDQAHQVASYVLNYRMNLLEPYRMKEKNFIVYSSNFREVMRVMKTANNRKALKELLAQDKRFETMDPEAVDVINACTNARIKYNRRQRKVNMRSAFVEEREEGFAEGMKKGLEKGRVEGMEKGRAKGRAEGKAEGQNQEKLAIALRMLTEKLLDAPTIAKVTGLTLQQVQALQTTQ